MSPHDKWVASHLCKTRRQVYLRPEVREKPEFRECYWEQYRVYVSEQIPSSKLDYLLTIRTLLNSKSKLIGLWVCGGVTRVPQVGAVLVDSGRSLNKEHTADTETKMEKNVITFIASSKPSQTKI